MKCWLFLSVLAGSIFLNSCSKNETATAEEPIKKLFAAYNAGDSAAIVDQLTTSAQRDLQANSSQFSALLREMKGVTLEYSNLHVSEEPVLKNSAIYDASFSMKLSGKANLKKDSLHIYLTKENDQWKLMGIWPKSY
jgi:hypothetical protein